MIALQNDSNLRRLPGILSTSSDCVKARECLMFGHAAGAVISAAKDRVRPGGMIVGADAAMEMIRFACKETRDLVLARVPGLPFSNDSFDAALAGFVVSHFETYLDGLRDMVRVCRTGGRVAMSAWGSLPNPAAILWSEVAGQYASSDELNEAFLEHVPWQNWFSNIENLAAALRESGLSSVNTATRVYSIRMLATEFLLSREASLQGFVLRQTLTQGKWDDFTNHVSEVFRSEFGEAVGYQRDVHFAVGTKVSSV